MPITIKGAAPLLQVFDISASLAFYRDKLGFNLADSSGQGDDSGWALLKLNNVELMLNTAYEDDKRPPAPDPARMKHHDDTAIYFGCPDVEATYEYLISKEVTAHKPYITQYGWKAMDITDPDGYHLCFHWPLS